MPGKIIWIGVFPGLQFEEPEHLAAVVVDYRAGRIAPVFMREFPLTATPPPHVVFGRATKFDFVLVGTGAGAMFAYRTWGLSELQQLLARDAAAMLCAWASEQGLPCDLERTQEALDTGAWPREPDCVLQAASYAHHMAAALACKEGNVVYGCDDVGEGVWLRVSRS